MHLSQYSTLALAALVAGSIFGSCAPDHGVDDSAVDTLLVYDMDVSPKGAVSVPAGFTKVSGASGTGVTLYVQKYTKAGWEPDFVMVVDLTQATLENYAGTVSSSKVTRQSMSTFWTTAKAAETSTKTLMGVFNGTFFDTGSDPTPIAFGLKVDGTTASTGYSMGAEFGSLEELFMFNQSRERAYLKGYKSTYFSSTSYPDIVGILDPSANKSSTSNIQRTFVGLVDQDGDTYYETVLFYTSKKATQSWAKTILTSFGAADTAMLDGGSSTQFRYTASSTDYCPTSISSSRCDAISTTRKVPNVLAIYAGQ